MLTLGTTPFCFHFCSIFIRNLSRLLAVFLMLLFGMDFDKLSCLVP